MIVDSSMSFAEAIAGTNAPPGVIGNLCLLEVCYRSFDGERHQGQMVVHRELRQDLLEIFTLVEHSGFPVAKVIPAVKYGWSDDLSMADNNSSAFNYRFIAGTQRLSLHALGRAVDINPFQNPVFYEDGASAPPGAAYDPAAEGTLSEKNPVVRAFKTRGWRWGGNFKSIQDNHHFEKMPPDVSAAPAAGSESAF
jgi:peptidoglycan LD-endopeptidase CwlK